MDFGIWYRFGNSLSRGNKCVSGELLQLYFTNRNMTGDRPTILPTSAHG